MKTAIKVLSYTLAIVSGLGALVMIGDGSMDVATFIALGIVEAQCILTLIYVD